MGIRERQEREREAVRRAILDAARDLFVTEGFEQVSMRKIAERIEYSPAAIYGYFPSKDDLFFALAEEGFRLLYLCQRPSAAANASQPVDQVREMFWRFYVFSREQPQYFALMFIDRSVPRISREYERFALAREMRATLITHVRAATDAGALPATVAPEAIFRMLTSAVIGVAVMRLSDRLAPGEDADTLAADALDIMLAGLAGGVPLRSSTLGAALDSCATAPHDIVSSQEPVS